MRKARVVFQIRLKQGREADFLRAYEAIRHSVAQGVRGHLVDQVCKAVDSPQDWLITSEWESIDCFLEWERDPQHRTLVAPLRACWEAAKSFRYMVYCETGAGAGLAGIAR